MDTSFNAKAKTKTSRKRRGSRTRDSRPRPGPRTWPSRPKTIPRTEILSLRTTKDQEPKPRTTSLHLPPPQSVQGCGPQNQRFCQFLPYFGIYSKRPAWVYPLHDFYKTFVDDGVNDDKQVWRPSGKPTARRLKAMTVWFSFLFLFIHQRHRAQATYMPVKSSTMNTCMLDNETR